MRCRRHFGIAAFQHRIGKRDFLITSCAVVNPIQKNGSMSATILSEHSWSRIQMLGNSWVTFFRWSFEMTACADKCDGHRPPLQNERLLLYRRSMTVALINTCPA